MPRRAAARALLALALAAVAFFGAGSAVDYAIDPRLYEEGAASGAAPGQNDLVLDCSLVVLQLVVQPLVLSGLHVLLVLLLLRLFALLKQLSSAVRQRGQNGNARRPRLRL